MNAKSIARLTGVVLVSAAAFAAAPAKAAAIYYLTTGQTGAQTQIDVNHSSDWLIAPTANWDLGGGNFEMKDGPSTAADVVLSLYLGSDATGTLLRSILLTHTAFCAQVSNCQSFDTHEFHFTTAYTLEAGKTYFAALTSSADDEQSKAYFIKQEQRFIVDEGGNPPPGGGLVPEPGVLALFGAAFASLGVIRRRRAA